MFKVMKKAPVGYEKLSYPRPRDSQGNLNLVDVIVHHTAGAPSALNTMAWQLEKRNGSYHFVVSGNGDVYAGVPLNRVSWGALGDDGKRCDWRSVNVALAGDNTKVAAFPLVQTEAAAELIAGLVEDYGLSVTTHMEKSPRQKPFDHAHILQWRHRIYEWRRRIQKGKSGND